jgi:hypothetical protein
MLGEEMGSSANRGSVIWILASSRPDLIQVDFKRPGRVDVKIPLFPTSTKQESFDLLRMLLKKRSIDLPAESLASLHSYIPLLLTPGARSAGRKNLPPGPQRHQPKARRSDARLPARIPKPRPRRGNAIPNPPGSSRSLRPGIRATLLPPRQSRMKIAAEATPPAPQSSPSYLSSPTLARHPEFASPLHSSSAKINPHLAAPVHATPPPDNSANHPALRSTSPA